MVAKCEELRGRVSGLYIERSMTTNIELSTEDLHDKMKQIFPSKKHFLKEQQTLLKELFPDDEPKIIEHNNKKDDS